MFLARISRYCLIAVLAGSAAGAAPAGALIFPNSDFELGTLENWTAEGEAFQFQPTRGDNARVRDPGRPAMPQGKYYVGTYDHYQGLPGQRPGASQTNAPRGGLISDPFIIEKPFIGFLIGGGDHDTVGVRLVVGTDIVRTACGLRTPTMRRVVWDVSEYRGEKARIYIVDGSSAPWGIVNADDFRYYDASPDSSLFPNSGFTAGLDGWEVSGAFEGEAVNPGAPGAHFLAETPYLAARTKLDAEERTGALASPPFQVAHAVLLFSVGGLGGAVRLMVNGEPVLSESLLAEDAEAAGLRTLRTVQWNLEAWRGKEARLVIEVDGSQSVANLAVGGLTWGRLD
jgi:hypothetical protein